jgi:hypothetical protein
MVINGVELNTRTLNELAKAAGVVKATVTARLLRAAGGKFEYRTP